MSKSIQETEWFKFLAKSSPELAIYGVVNLLFKMQPVETIILALVINFAFAGAKRLIAILESKIKVLEIETERLKIRGETSSASSQA